MNAYFARLKKNDTIEACNDVMETITYRRDERIIFYLECRYDADLETCASQQGHGPCGVLAKALKHCAEQLASALQTLFQDSFDQGILPNK